MSYLRRRGAIDFMYPQGNVDQTRGASTRQVLGCKILGQKLSKQTFPTSPDTVAVDESW